MIKAIFLDVDGTLFSHTISDIPASALQGLHALRRKGILIFLATGRHRLTLRKLNLHDFPFDGYITLTGHLCYDRRWAPLLRQPLAPEDTAVLAEAFRTRRMPMMLVQENREYINYTDDLARKLFSDVSSRVPEVSDYDGSPLYSAAIYCPPETARALERDLPGCRLSAWHTHGFDIISREVGKVQGMEEIMRHYGLRREEIAAFGDADNDEEMISYAGVGVAMGNGMEKAKAAADYVTSSIDEDGLFRAFRHLKLL